MLCLQYFQIDLLQQKFSVFVLSNPAAIHDSTSQGQNEETFHIFLDCHCT